MQDCTSNENERLKPVSDFSNVCCTKLLEKYINKTGGRTIGIVSTVAQNARLNLPGGINIP